MLVNLNSCKIQKLNQGATDFSVMERSRGIHSLFRIIQITFCIKLYKIEDCAICELSVCKIGKMFARKVNLRRFKGFK